MISKHAVFISNWNRTEPKTTRKPVVFILCRAVVDVVPNVVNVLSPFCPKAQNIIQIHVKNIIQKLYYLLFQPIRMLDIPTCYTYCKIS